MPNDPVGQVLDDDIVLVDIGSRNGILEMPELRDRIQAYGFEPCQQEYDKLINNTTDAEKISPRSRVHYKEERYLPYAITASCGECTLYVTQGIGASSTLLPNYELVNRFQLGSWWNRFPVVREERVPSKTLLGFINETDISHIDYLKLDTQGNEFEILNSPGLLQRISVIKTEVEFWPLYKNQKLYHDISSLLYRHSFLQIDLKFQEVHYRGLNSESLTGRPLVWADAYYVNTDIVDKYILTKQSIVLLCLGYMDMSLDIVRRNRLFGDEVFFDLAAWIERKRRGSWTLRRVVKRAIEKLFKVKISRLS
jgi:FkbM family methyltransferase